MEVEKEEEEEEEAAQIKTGRWNITLGKMRRRWGREEMETGMRVFSLFPLGHLNSKEKEEAEWPAFIPFPSPPPPPPPPLPFATST